MMDSTLTAIRANASGSPVGRALNIAKSRSLSVKDAAKYNAIGSLVGWNTEVSRKTEQKVSNFHKEMKSRYPLLYVLNEWSVRNVVTADHLAKYLKVM